MKYVWEDHTSPALDVHLAEQPMSDSCH